LNLNVDYTATRRSPDVLPQLGST